MHGHGWTNTGQFLDRLWTQTAIQDNTWTHTGHSPDNCWTVAADVLNAGAAANANHTAEYCIEAMLDEVGRNHEPFRVNLGSVGAVLGPTLPIFGPTWAHLKPSWDGSELYWSHLGAN